MNLNSVPSKVEIDIAQRFPRLRLAPIVEAVIDLRCRNVGEWDEDQLKEKLARALDGYVYDGSLHAVRHHVEISKGVPQPPQSEDLGFQGLRYRSNDGHYISQFKRDGFALSRLAPYDTWDSFKGETYKLWEIYKTMAESLDIVRIGVRFINSFDIEVGAEESADIFHVSPAVPRGLPLNLSQFLHQDTMLVPGHPYGITVTRARQPKPDGLASVILDIDAFTLPDAITAEEELEFRLAQLRWLKNKAFEGSISTGLIRSFGKGTE